MKRNVLSPFLFVAMLVLVVGLACGIDLGTTPTDSAPAPAPVIQPTQQTAPLQQSTPQQIEQPTQIPPTAVTQSRFFTENFDTNVDNWSRVHAKVVR